MYECIVKMHSFFIKMVLHMSRLNFKRSILRACA